MLEGKVAVCAGEFLGFLHRHGRGSVTSLMYFVLRNYSVLYVPSLHGAQYSWRPCIDGVMQSMDVCSTNSC